MDVQAVAVTTDNAKPPTRQADKPKRLSVRGKLAIALRSIIHEGQEIPQAAKLAGITGNCIRLALAKPHVIQWMRNEREVFRAYVSAQNIHYARELRNSSDNGMVRLGAIKVIEQIGDEQHGSAAGVRSPGFVIVVNNAPNVAPPTIDVTPMTDRR